ncbi:TPA: hypothetical protein ACH3X2_013932 [Trebouxia sp. C0005]
MPYAPLLRLQTLPRSTCDIVEDGGPAPISNIMLPPKQMLLAAKRPLNFSGVAVGLCRSLSCDAQPP